MSAEDRTHTHSLMVEKPFSSSCLRSITAVSLKPPPEPFSAAALVDHQAAFRYRPWAKLQSRPTKAARSFVPSNNAFIFVIILPLEECRTVEIAGRKRFNGGLTHRHFRRSSPAASTDWLVAKEAAPLFPEEIFPSSVLCFVHHCPSSG